MDDPLCPRCGKEPLAAVDDKDVAFLGCQKCYGLFVTEPDLFTYVEKAASPRVFAAFVELHERMLAHQAKGTMRGCPQCRQVMKRVTFGDNPMVLLDRCEEHGLWLDRTELNKVIRAARAAAGGKHEIEEDDEDVGPLKGAPPDPPKLP